MNDDGCLGVTPENLYALFSFFHPYVASPQKRIANLLSLCL